MCPPAANFKLTLNGLSHRIHPLRRIRLGGIQHVHHPYKAGTKCGTRKELQFVFTCESLVIMVSMMLAMLITLS